MVTLRAKETPLFPNKSNFQLFYQPPSFKKKNIFNIILSQTKSLIDASQIIKIPSKTFSSRKYQCKFAANHFYGCKPNLSMSVYFWQSLSNWIPEICRRASLIVSKICNLHYWNQNSSFSFIFLLKHRISSIFIQNIGVIHNLRHHKGGGDRVIKITQRLWKDMVSWATPDYF